MDHPHDPTTDPLRAADDARNRRLDEQLHDAAVWLRDVAPDLCERVADASAPLLGARRRLRLAGSPATPARHHVRQTARLALAASLGLAFVTAAWFIRVPLQTSAPPAMVDAVPARASFETAAERDMQAEYMQTLVDTVGSEGEAFESYLAVASLTFEDVFLEAERLSSDLGGM